MVVLLNPTDLGVGGLLDQPFFVGSITAAPSIPDPYPVAIGGRRYMVDWAKYQRGVVSPFRSAQDQNALPGETSLNPAAAWKRNRDDWTLGAGQVWADHAMVPYNQRIELEPRQFYRSKGIDPWESHAFKLLPATETRISSSSVIAKMLSHGNFLYWCNATGMSRVLTPMVPGATNAITGLPGTIANMTSDGSQFYISTPTGIYVHNPAGTTAAAMPGAAATFPCGPIAWANGWLLVANNNVVSEVRANGTVNTVKTHPSSLFVWKEIAGSPGHIYLAGQGTDLAEIYRVEVDDTGALTVPIYAGSLPRGETLASISYYGGKLLIGSSKGLRLADILADGTLDMGPSILDQIKFPVLCTYAEGQYVWFGWTKYDTVSSGLGRVDLANYADFQNTLPATASDLMFNGQGDVTAVCRHLGHTFYAMSGVGIVQEKIDKSYVASGTLEMGRFRWSTYEPKVLLGIEVVTEPLRGRVSMDALLENGDTVTLGSRNDDDQIGLGIVFGVSAIHEAHDWYAPIITLLPSAAKETPVIHRITLRALPVPKVVEQYIVPIIMAQNVNLEQGEGQEQAYNTREEYTYLLGLVQSGTPVIYQEGRDAHFVTVREVGWGEQSITGMDFQRTGLQGLLLVTLVTAEV